MVFNLNFFPVLNHTKTIIIYNGNIKAQIYPSYLEVYKHTKIVWSYIKQQKMLYVAYYLDRYFTNGLT